MPCKLLPSFVPTFWGVFPQRLKCHLFASPILKNRLIFNRNLTYNMAQSGRGRYSIRSGRESKGSDFRMDMRAGASKSLVEDEAELSDWVTGLSSSSFKKTRVYSDSDNDDDGGGNAGLRSREGAGKRRREGEFDSKGKGGAMRQDAFTGSRKNADGYGGRGRDRDSNDFGRGDKPISYGGRGSGRDSSDFQRGEKTASYGGRGRDRDSSDFQRGGKIASYGGRGGGRGSSDFQKGGGRSTGFMSRGNDGGRGSDRDFSEFKRGGRPGGPTEEKNGRTPGFLSRRNDGGRGEDRDLGDFKRGARPGSSFNRGRRDVGVDHGGFIMKKEGKEMGKGHFLLTDDEDVTEENTYSSFKELIDSEEEDDVEEEGEEEGEEEEEEEEGADRLFREETSSFRNSGSSAGSSNSYLSESRFDQCSISSLSLKGIKDAGYEKMTLVQEATLPVILKGKDVLAKARTGTGKTVAFLLPAIEAVVKLSDVSHVSHSEKRPPILVLVICPTRELACQAAAEATKLLKYHPSIGTQVVIGGTRLALEQKKMQANACQILVATPGRLRDHIENTAGFATRLMGVKILVLDEADHLLGMGFRSAIENIVAAVPKQRQTLLFSATIPPEVRQISHIALKRDHEFINTVEEGTEDTHTQVRQTHLVSPLENHFSLLYSLLKEHIADDASYKVLVFCTTAMVTKLVAELLSQLNLNVREIHSRKSQSYRTKVSDEFRKSNGLILVTSDVSARGVDYPDVTLVVQLGLPADKQQYVHRLGRTGRKGKEGQGILLLAPWEEVFLSSIKDLPVSKATEPLVDQDTKKKVDRALSHVESKSKESAYQAWLGYYNSNKKVGGDKYKLVELANEFSRCMGLDSPPAISKMVLGKMGLKNVPGLRAK